MSKYTEPILEKESFVIRCESSLDYHRDNESLFLAIREELEDARIDLEALQIADRLEQADAVDVHNRFCTKFYTECYFKDGCKETGHKCLEAVAWENGYNQALADVRGDNNDD